MIPVVTQHEIAAFRNLEMIVLWVHGFRKIWLIQGSVRLIDVYLVITDIHGFTWKSYDSLYQPGLVLARLRFVVKEYDIPPLRLCSEGVWKPGTDDPVTCHNGILHGTRRNVAVGDDKGIEDKGNGSSGQQNFDPLQNLLFKAGVSGMFAFCWCVHGSLLYNKSYLNRINVIYQFSINVL